MRAGREYLFTKPSEDNGVGSGAREGLLEEGEEDGDDNDDLEGFAEDDEEYCHGSVSALRGIN
jgi:hypothetical protein